jgi:hypothetical protein
LMNCVRWWDRSIVLSGLCEPIGRATSLIFIHRSVAIKFLLII